MNATRKSYLFTIACCCITAAALLAYDRITNRKIAVVDAVKVFNSYKMKSEMETISARELKPLTHRADSLKQAFNAQRASRNLPDSSLERLYMSFRQADAAVNESFQKSNQAINEQVWKRLNPLIDEYARAEGLRLVIGANGMGSVLYNDDYYDKTQEVIDYVNKNYEDGN